MFSLESRADFALVSRRKGRGGILRRASWVSEVAVCGQNGTEKVVITVPTNPGDEPFFSFFLDKIVWHVVQLFLVTVLCNVCFILAAQL